MNPFTRSLLPQIHDRQIVDFVEHWDELEALIIRVFRNKRTTPEDEGQYQRLRAWLQQHYPTWQPRLEPHWQQALIAGELARQDPYLFLLAHRQASGFIANWTAMQTLPAAREALNAFLVAQIESQ